MNNKQQTSLNISFPTTMQKNASSIIFFDGVCLLCNTSVRFVLKHDKKNVFRYAALQSDFAKRTLASFTETEGLDSIVLLENGRVFTKSEAALRIAGRLRFPWRLLRVFLMVPARVRDAFYDLMAAKRYRWFGKLDRCPLPPAGYRSLFLD